MTTIPPPRILYNDSLSLEERPAEERL